ncbi:MAG: SEL1-like repeat protein [Synergistaceae bacterium]|nr:SEL1-like repeat protein [Synergistaceae bacterium]
MYEKAATQSLPDAQYGLGIIYRDGRGVPQSDEKAIEWFTKAAEQGDNDAKTELEKLSPQVK